MNKPISYRMAVAALGLALTLPSLFAAETPQEWYDEGRNTVQAAKRIKISNKRVKNIILVVGDGMGVSTVTAARIFDGQLKGQSGEENSLSFEKFPHLALSKTYSVNQQTSDSAPTMTAMVTGVKTKDGLLGVNQLVERRNASTVAGNELETILEICEKQGKSSGVVSSARLTHATPAACYSKSPDRDWEADVNIPAAQRWFPDIARQLVEFRGNGTGLEVALGGGRTKFIPNTIPDPEDAGRVGERLDGRDLTSEWSAKSPKHKYVWNKAGFDAINPATTDNLLGLFERSHCEYEHDRPSDTGGEPSLSEMTSKAIDILAKNRKGFFLMVEGGRIDHAHHAGNAFRALSDTVELSKAVEVALAKTDPNETLIIVTADHSHVFTIGGYPERGNPILGLVSAEADSSGNPIFTKDLLGLPYTTLSYANGPGYTGASLRANGTVLQPEGPKVFEHLPVGYQGITSGRPFLSEEVTMSPNFLQEATVPLGSETHAGEDVAIFATGPAANLFHGVQEQNVIFHVMLESLVNR
ncbi:MAG: alkaline phosphatase [Verrucomicrobiota bacterium]|nr:alkaline phosphatase [Verrucomicrobiota bacterium]